MADNGTISSVDDTQGQLAEKANIEFYNGIIIPGFVNCHCHIELSHMTGLSVIGEGLPGFIRMIRTRREKDTTHIPEKIRLADEQMYSGGIELCADICNTTVSFETKTNSKIHYINLLEVFGIDAGKARERLDEIEKVSEIPISLGLPSWIVPHSAYSLSLPLFRLLKRITSKNKVTSVHFMESPDEKIFLESHSGALMDSYISSGLGLDGFETVKDHPTAILEEITPSGNLILVHNTFADKETIRSVKRRKNLFWCLCPNSNLYIENSLPPVELLMSENCELVIGTDSLASNTKLSILEELKTLNKHFPQIPLEELIKWATINGATALGQENEYGKIEAGKRPGLLFLSDVDLVNLKLLPETNVTRLL